MKKIPILFILLVALVVTGYYEKSSRPDWKKISPFTAVSFDEERILVEFETVDYELISIAGIERTELIEAAKRKFGSRWQKRIREDIAEVLEAADAYEGRYVDLVVKDPESGSVKSFPGVEMTESNRRQSYASQ